MPNFPPIALILSLTAALLSPAFSQETLPGPTEYPAPLGSAMEEFHYPFPVKYLPLTIQGHDVRMAYMDLAPAQPSTKHPIVLLHGKNFYGSYWKDTATILSQHGHRVIIPDQIGFGKSSKPPINYSFDLLATNTLTLLDHLHVTHFHVLGHSMGGMLATRIARTYPTRTTTLILENPIGLEDYRFNVPPLTTEQVYNGELNTTDPVKIRRFLRSYVVTWTPDIYEPFVEVRTRLTHSGEYPRWAMAAALTYQMIYRQPVVHEFPLIKCPTLIVIGQEDRTTLGRNFVAPDIIKTMGNYPQLGKKTAQAIPNSTLIELENIGHIPHLENPDLYHQHLLDFLK